MSINDFITNNLTPIFGMIFLVIILGRSKTMDEVHRRLFFTILGFEVIEMVVYNLELVTASWDHPTSIRILLSAIGYSIRPLLVYLFIRLLKPKEKSKLRELGWFIPELIAIVTAFSAFFTKAAYTYDAHNRFHRGVFGYNVLIIIVIYILILAYFVIRSNLLEHSIANKLMLMIIGYIVTSMVLEALFNVRSIGRATMVLSTIFFLFALQINKLKLTINHLERNEMKLRYISEMDLMTGIKNRGTGERQIQNKMKQGIEGTLCLMDCDGFKKINDTYGHATGDKVLMAIADQMKEVCKEEDVAFRLGGDEFAFYIAQVCDVEQAESFFKRFFKKIECINLPEINGNKIQISLGAAFNRADSTDGFEELYKKADEALYQSKKETGCCATIFEGDLL